MKPKQLSDMHQKQVRDFMYYLTRCVAKETTNGFHGFLEDLEICDADWAMVRDHIEKALGVELYV